MKRTTAVLASAALLSVAFVGYDAASYAATGQSVILGKTNKSGKPTIVKMTKAGAALDLRTKAVSPPLKVSSGKKVAKLHADKLDGFDASALQTHATRFTIPAVAATSEFTRGLPITPGTHQISFNVTAGAVTGPIRCWLQLSGSHYVMINYGTQIGSFATVASTSVVTVAPGDTPALTCNASAGTMTIPNNAADRSVVSVIRIAAAVDPALAPRLAQRQQAPQHDATGN